MCAKRLKKDGQDWEDVPAFLSQGQRDDPMSVIGILSCWKTLYDVRELTINIFCAAMASSVWEDQTEEDKAATMFLFKQLIILVESSYLIDQKIEEGVLVYAIPHPQEEE
jgi:hypothetical protein